MIKLENISSIDFYRNPIVCKNGIYYADNAQGLKDISKIDSDLEYLDEVTKKVEKKAIKLNSKKIEPNVFETNRHSYEGKKESLLLKNDKLTKAAVLISNPVNYDIRSYQYLTIDEVKFLLSHIDENGKNLLERYRGVGPKVLKNVFESLDMYDEQVERQYDEVEIEARKNTSLIYQTDIFGNNRESKKEIVSDQLPYIVEYLLDNAESELVWTKLSDNQKMQLVRATKNNNDTRERLVETIANYTTLTELENHEALNGKALKRFIKQ